MTDRADAQITAAKQQDVNREGLAEEILLDRLGGGSGVPILCDQGRRSFQTGCPYGVSLPLQVASPVHIDGPAGGGACKCYSISCPIRRACPAV